MEYQGDICRKDDLSNVWTPDLSSWSVKISKNGENLDENGQISKKNEKFKKMVDKVLDNYMKYLPAKFHVSSMFG